MGRVFVTLDPAKPEVKLAGEERVAKQELLHDAHLLDRILDDFDRSSRVGEETNKLVGYL